MVEIDFLWKDRKRPIFGLPLSFTTYKLTDEKLLIKSGIFSIKEEEIKLYKITDLTLLRTFPQRLFGVGTIHICSGDKTTPEFDIKDVKNSDKVKELISDYVEKCRDKKRVSAREIISTIDDDEDDDIDIHG
jgi:uncharacterized membrane protein YdbT with pleckstrin-like domain